MKSSLTEDKTSNLTRIGVKTVDGVVYLQGVVDSEQDRGIAEDRTRRVPNVINVVNRSGQRIGRGVNSIDAGRDSRPS